MLEKRARPIGRRALVREHCVWLRRVATLCHAREKPIRSVYCSRYFRGDGLVNRYGSCVILSWKMLHLSMLTVHLFALTLFAVSMRQLVLPLSLSVYFSFSQFTLPHLAISRLSFAFALPVKRRLRRLVLDSLTEAGESVTRIARRARRVLTVRRALM